MARIMGEAGFNYLTADADKKFVIPEETDTNKLKGLSEEERNQLQDYFRTLFEERYLTKLKAAEKTKDYPRQMLAGLEEIIKIVYRDSREGDMLDPKWLFCRTYISPLADYLDYRIQHPIITPEEKSDETALEGSVEAVMDYDFILNLMKMQSYLLTGEQKEPSHRGVLIPIGKLQGATNYDGTSIWFTEKELVIYNSERGTFKYPLPAQTVDGEIAIKGGVARLVAKIALELPSTGELPPSDLDLVVFGASKGITMKELKSRYGVEAKDVEKITPEGVRGYNIYLGNRDQSPNEVLLTADGLVLSLDAISAFVQGTTQVTADSHRDLFGSHVLDWERRYIVEMLDGHDQFFVNGVRFPSPKALSRMYRNMIEEKADSFTVPKGALKLDIGIRWLVMARKFLAVEDKKRRNELLENMVLLAQLVGSPYAKAMQGDSPHEFINKVKEMAPGGKDFNMGAGELSEKETLDWIAGKLVKQIMGRLDRYIGRDAVISFRKQLTDDDAQPIQITLPRPEMEAEEPKKVDPGKALQEKMVALIESFSEPGLIDGEEVEYARNWVEAWFATSPDYERCRLFAVPSDRAERFYRAGEKMELVSRKYRGHYYPQENFVFFIAQEGSPFLEIFLHETFHSTGRHYVKIGQGGEFLGGFQDDTEGEQRRGELFEEGLTGMAIKTFLDEHNLPEDGFISPEANSTWAGVALTRILDSVGNKKDDLLAQLFKARIGDKMAESSAKKIIDDRFGAGFFNYLMQVDLYNHEDLIALYEKLGLRQS